jgi:multidrug efflux pump subunit AcrA (membrane-fusion protein)
MKNLIGNALTVLILLMSCFFFAAALMVGAAQRNWKAEVADVTSRLQAAERQVNEAKSSSKNKEMTIEREKVARALKIANLNSQLRQIDEQLDDRNKVLKAEIEFSQERLARLREAEARLAQQDKELEEIKARNTELKNDLSEQYLKVQNLTQKSFEQKTQIDSLDQSVADLMASLAVKEKIMFSVGLDDNYLVKDIEPKLTATVVKIGKKNTFAIKLGKDDGVRIDHEFDIYRGNRFIGRAIVVDVNNDAAVLKPINGFLQSPIQEGDYVTSEF